MKTLLPLTLINVKQKDNILHEAYFPKSIDPITINKTEAYAKRLAASKYQFTMPGINCIQTKTKKNK